MELPNIHFQDYPIEFKEINPEDYPQLEVENYRSKHIVSPDENGYIHTVIQPLLQLDYKNTVVINAAVGQGKSYAIIQTIKRYYEAEDDYLIVVASPFVSLVTQYCNDIRDAGVPEEQIYNYGDLGRRPEISYLNKAVQVVTVNTLLGNPGEDAFKNSNAKRQYINDLINHCKQQDKKVVFVYDEIHDSYHNFKEEYIFNLWKWRDVILKNFILSASYNEASKVVIEYLAELTDKRIKIIESKRIVNEEKQSDLYLHFNSAQQYKYNNDHIVRVVSNLINKGKEIDILCYSKTLASDLIKSKDGEIRRLLLEKYGEINNCTSELVSNQRTENSEPQNRYDNSKCNIGTNFKTGVSIKKENHAFIIIMPPRGTRLWFKNKSGIFSGGINSVIQALARQRVKGEIHIILPNPDKFDFTSLNASTMSDIQKESFEKNYKKYQSYKTVDKLVEYLPLSSQDILIRNFYEKELKRNVLEEIEYLSEQDRGEFVSLKYPTYKIFKLEKGEEYLANVYPYLGEDISAYTTYAAFTNQFINCKLKGITNKPIVYIIEGKEQESLHKFFELYLGVQYNDAVLEWSNHRRAYLDFKNQLFNNYTIGYYNEEDGSFKQIKRNASKVIERNILRFVHSKIVKEITDPSQMVNEYLNNIGEYTRGGYFLECIAHAKDINIDEVDFSDIDKKRIKAYQLLGYFREKIISSISHYNFRRKEYFYVPLTPLEGFLSTTEYSMLLEIISLLRESDELIANDVFEFSDRIARGKSVSSKITSFYKILIEDFLILDSSVSSIEIGGLEKRKRVKKVNGINLIPNKANSLDLVSPEKHYYPIEKIESWAIQNYGSLEEYNNIINSELN
ncbi:DEAD/DEAH box helicase family protein [Pseudofulvibacter geojedonensis]|uniref:DEAD/DEAH box helicase family protein n=1 Tax=Pseudofulvibacter geojedonensis TaxID=1123758 RepID=A0ABW3I3E3_9FLAO